MSAATLWALGRRLLFFAIPVPVALLLALWGWLTVDKYSSIRLAVDRALENLVNGAELDAARARAASLEMILDHMARQAEADRDALAAFADQLAAAQSENGNLADALRVIENQPVDPLCRVDRALLDRLRERQGGAARGGRDG